MSLRWEGGSKEEKNVFKMGGREGGKDVLKMGGKEGGKDVFEMGWREIKSSSKIKGEWKRCLQEVKSIFK